MGRRTGRCQTLITALEPTAATAAGVRPTGPLWQGFSLKELEIAIGHHLEEAVTGQCEFSTKPETNVSPAEGGLWLRLTSTAVTSTGRKLL